MMDEHMQIKTTERSRHLRRTTLIARIAITTHVDLKRRRHEMEIQNMIFHEALVQDEHTFSSERDCELNMRALVPLIREYSLKRERQQRPSTVCTKQPDDVARNDLSLLLVSLSLCDVLLDAYNTRIEPLRGVETPQHISYILLRTRRAAQTRRTRIQHARTLFIAFTCIHDETTRETKRSLTLSLSYASITCALLAYKGVMRAS